MNECSAVFLTCRHQTFCNSVTHQLCGPVHFHSTLRNRIEVGGCQLIQLVNLTESVKFKMCSHLAMVGRWLPRISDFNCTSYFTNRFRVHFRRWGGSILLQFIHYDT
jgi:hypothetical protein